MYYTKDKDEKMIYKMRDSLKKIKIKGAKYKINAIYPPYM